MDWLPFVGKGSIPHWQSRGYRGRDEVAGKSVEAYGDHASHLSPSVPVQRVGRVWRRQRVLGNAMDKCPVVLDHTVFLFKSGPLAGRDDEKLNNDGIHYRRERQSPAELRPSPPRSAKRTHISSQAFRHWRFHETLRARERGRMGERAKKSKRRKRHCKASTLERGVEFIWLRS
jgi:hypothetical protein